MPPKKARFGNGGKRGGKGGKGDRGYGGRDSWRDDYRDRDHRPSWRDDNDYYDDWGDRGGKGRSYWDGPSGSNPRDRDRFITQMMEDERYQYRKQYDPDFIGSGASASVPSSEGGKANENEDDAEFDAALEKRRNDRKKKKTEQHSKLDRLVDVAARLECLEEELGKATADKAPNEALLTCAEWEVLKQRSAEKGQNARERAQRDYEDRKTRRDEQEQARLDKLAKKNSRNTVARNLDGIGNGGFFASLGGDENPTPEETPSAVLEYLRGRLREANTKEALRATKLQAPSGAHASAITKLSNRVHKEVLYDESHVACLESLKDEFGLLTSATTAPGLLKCFLNALYVRKVDVIPVQLGLAM